uniref:Uncharacterized protein n=1 Tax=Tanacetum cinerariifolium TaxID=118510 RepID=A0A6L2P6M5_TANCI|nr:hypothetical protein [Tanacetum cinerariifolium]
MRFLKRFFAGLLGSSHHEQQVNENNNNDNLNSVEEEELDRNEYNNIERKGFSVKRQVPVDKAHQIGPVLVPCPARDGGVQGLEWYTRSLKIDEDGDVADEFLEEVPTRTPNKNANELHHKTMPKFKAKLVTNPAKARNPRLSSEGRVYVKCQGRVQLIG